MTATASTAKATRQSLPTPPTEKGLPSMGMSRTFGDVEVTRIPEFTTAFPRSFVFPDTDVRLWQEHQHGLAPRFWEPEADNMLVAVQSWLIRSAGQTILVDTGVGNHKDRPGMAMFDHLSTDYLDNLAHAGVTRDDVDVVVCTHLHSDHVGWNTTYTDNGWMPTFPNARYLLPRADFDYWNPANAHRPDLAPWARNAFLDSVTPVHQSGQAELWEGDCYDIDEHLRLEPVPGHTLAARCCSCDRAPTERSSSAICSTARCKSPTPTTVRASTKTPPKRQESASQCSKSSPTPTP